MKKYYVLMFIVLNLFTACSNSSRILNFSNKNILKSDKVNSYAKWKNQGYSFYVYNFYIKHGISLEELTKWKLIGINDKVMLGESDILKWKDITNNNIALAKKWIKLQKNSKRALNIIEKTNVKNPDEFIKYLKVIKNFKHSNNSLNNKFTLIHICKKNNITSDELVEWDKLGIKNIDYIIKLKQENLSFKKISKFYQLGIKNINFIKKIIHKNISPNIIAPYYKVGIANLDKILVFSKLHINPKKAKKYSELYYDYYFRDTNSLKKIIKSCPKGVYVSFIDFFDMPLYHQNISKNNAFSTKGKCYEYLGKVTQVLSRKEVIIREFLKHDKYLGDLFNGRQSILIFRRKLPNYITKNIQVIGIIKGIGYQKMHTFDGKNVYVDKFIPIKLEKY